MHLLFIDESGSLAPIGKHCPNDKFVLGSIIISESTWFKVNENLNYLKRNKYKIHNSIRL